MEAAQKTYLTLREFAQFMGRSIATIENWVKAGRVTVVRRETAQRTFYRVPVEEAQAVKQRLESGLWV